MAVSRWWHRAGALSLALMALFTARQDVWGQG